MKQIGMVMAVATIACGAALSQDAKGVIVFHNETGGKIVFGAAAGGAGIATLGLMGPVVKGAPYSAQGITESTQTLGDGTHITHQETYTIYRDGEGRMRRENGDQAWISDPVAGATYIVHLKEQTARKMPLTQTIAYKKMQQMRWKTDGPAVNEIPGPKTESLGKQEMEGVEVEGTRETMVIPQGQIGNDRPIQTVHERWESPELQITILAKHTDPMMGDSTERLTNVQRGEPDPALFQVPAGFTIESGK